MSDKNYFLANVARWSAFSPLAAALLKEPLPDENLQDFDPTKLPSLEGLNVLYAYGLTQNLYSTLKGFIEKDNHALIILEEDLKVIAKYFTTDEAKELLNDERVWLYHLDPTLDALKETANLFPTANYEVVITSPSKSNEKKLSAIQAELAFQHFINSSVISEYNNGSDFFFNNLYHNLFALPNSFLGDTLIDSFKGVPALICGAGPSLVKNIDLLKELKDRALIFAGGTTMNALNSHDMLPHLGLSIDPNDEQVTRIIMNNAFEIPFIYKGRVNNGALKLIHGDKIYITGSGGHSTGKYFEKKLNITSEHEIEEGWNVINFSLAVAAAMGCNPIILIGLDLAYSQDQTYASGMFNHPIHKPFNSKAYSDPIIYRKDVNGEPVATLWKWVNESVWFSTFASQHPETTIINATEGGIGFACIPSMSLEGVKDQYLNDDYAIDLRLFGAIQRGQISQEVNKDKILNLLIDLNKSHKIVQNKLQEHYNTLITMEKDKKSIENDGKLQSMLIDKIKDEISYKYLICDFIRAYNLMKYKEYKRLQIDKECISQEEHLKRLLQLEMERVFFLQHTLSINEMTIQNVIAEKSIKVAPPEKDDNSKDALLKASEPTSKHINTPLDEKEERYQLFQENGNVIFESTRVNGKLHGFSRCYGNDGFLLAESLYQNGKQEGDVYRYYATHNLHSIQRYKTGKQQGKQEYYYNDGKKRLIISNCSEGLLDGMVSLYHRNGSLARQLTFVKGKREGLECLYNETGTLLVEANFKDNRPIGKARVWHWNGQLAQDFEYDDNGKLLNFAYFYENGEKIDTEKSEIDYFQNVAATSEQLTSNLSTLVDELNRLLVGREAKDGGLDITPELEQLTETFALLGASLANLESLNKKLTEEAHPTTQSKGAPFWKSAALQKEIDNKLKAASSDMQNELEQLRSSVTSLIKNLAKDEH